MNIRGTLIKADKTGLGVFMTAIPGNYVFREAVGYVARSDGISMQVSCDSHSKDIPLNIFHFVMEKSAWMIIKNVNISSI